MTRPKQTSSTVTPMSSRRGRMMRAGTPMMARSRLPRLASARLRAAARARSREDGRSAAPSLVEGRVMVRSATYFSPIWEMRCATSCLKTRPRSS